MRHRKRSRRLVGKWEHRKALLRNLLMALFIHERIKTTEAKAKELRRLADKMISLAKRGDLAARRQALSILPNKAVVRKLFSEIKDRYAYRQSGFTRIVRIGPRRGDAAMMVLIELVTDKLEHKRSPRKIEAEEAAQKEIPETEARAEAAEEGAQEASPEASEKTEAEVEAPEASSEAPEMEAASRDSGSQEEMPEAVEKSETEQTSEDSSEKAETSSEKEEKEKSSEGS